MFLILEQTMENEKIIIVGTHLFEENFELWDIDVDAEKDVEFQTIDPNTRNSHEIAADLKATTQKMFSMPNDIHWVCAGTHEEWDALKNLYQEFEQVEKLANSANSDEFGADNFYFIRNTVKAFVLEYDKIVENPEHPIDLMLVKRIDSLRNYGIDMPHSFEHKRKRDYWNDEFNNNPPIPTEQLVAEILSAENSNRSM